MPNVYINGVPPKKSISAKAMYSLEQVLSEIVGKEVIVLLNPTPYERAFLASSEPPIAYEMAKDNTRVFVDWVGRAKDIKQQVAAAIDMFLQGAELESFIVFVDRPDSHTYFRDGEPL